MTPEERHLRLVQKDESEVPKYKRALVIGKFYPPHNGHVYLATTAGEIADQAVVLVYGSQYHKIALKDRVEWLQAEVPDNVRVYGLINDIYDDYVDLNVWEAHDRVMKAKLREIGGYTPDVIVSSEGYGAQVAEAFGPDCSSYVVDQKRIAHPISGTAARANVEGSWEHLPLSTRKGLIPRVIVVGAESTGTTTLSKALAEYYSARYVPEYGRQYTIDWLDSMREAVPEATMDDLVWREPDFERIAKYQTVLENRAAVKRDGFPLVVADTDAFATALWATRYLVDPDQLRFHQPWASHIHTEWASTNLPRRDLYILTNHEGVEFEDDGYRDGEHIRGKMTSWFEDALTATEKSWVLVSGTHEERMKIAIKMIDRIIDEKLHFD